jgi:deoxyribose-phosphate aldolase
MKKIGKEKTMNKKQCASLIDHTCLRANAQKKDIEQLCHEAIRYGFRAVCVNQTWVSLCAKLLKKHPRILIACVVDFPLGAGDVAQKKALAIIAKNAGATELDVVMNIGKFLDGDYKEVEDELKVVASVLPTKVIIETGHLSDKEILKAAEIVERAKADFIKTSTGWKPEVEIKEKARQVALIREHFPGLKIKAAGGIKTPEDLRLMLNSGANVIGASAGVAMVKSIV